jgi:hypothetical protein
LKMDQINNILNKFATENDFFERNIQIELDIL